MRSGDEQAPRVIAIIPCLVATGLILQAQTVKHYAVHSGPEPERHTFDAVIDDNLLFESMYPQRSGEFPDARPTYSKPLPLEAGREYRIQGRTYRYFEGKRSIPSDTA